MLDALSVNAGDRRASIGEANEIVELTWTLVVKMGEICTNEIWICFTSRQPLGCWYFLALREKLPCLRQPPNITAKIVGPCAVEHIKVRPQAAEATVLGEMVNKEEMCQRIVFLPLLCTNSSTLHLERCRPRWGLGQRSNIWLGDGAGRCFRGNLKVQLYA